MSVSHIPPWPTAGLHQAAIALGSNLGDSYAILTTALQELAQLPGISVKSHSHWYLTVAIGPPQPDFLNGCALLETRYAPQDLLAILLGLEVRFGRVRRQHWGPRRLDLDLLFYDDLILQTPELQLPHPRMQERAFVLVPLAEILPDWVYPGTGRAIADLLQTVDCTGVRQLPG